MANYQNIVRLRPEVREFIRHRRLVQRGDVIAYGPNIRCEAFSTDGRGYRHSVFEGETLSLADCIRGGRYGVVLGPSSIYGFGLAGNGNTMGSLLGERFGFPFGNVGLPEGNSRNLHAILTELVARGAPPAAVVHVSGGDYTSFCYIGLADPVFGPPNLEQSSAMLKKRGPLPVEERRIKPLLAFTTLWIGAVVQLCRAERIPLVLADDTTFFEKGRPGAIERQSELGSPFNPAQELQFETHKRFADDYHSRRRKIAERMQVPLAGPGLSNDIGFIDEFHYDREGTRALTADFANALAPLL